MKYNGFINYVFCDKYKINLSLACLLDYITQISSWAEGKEFEGEIYYYLSTGKITEDLPIISSNKNTFNRYIKELKDLGFIDSKFMNNKSFYKITEKGKEYISGCENNHIEGVKIIIAGCENNPDNNNITYNKINNNILAENIYKEYFKNIPNDKKQYVKKSQTILYITQLLKEYKESELLSSIKNYFKNTDKLYIKAPQYFFSNTKSGKDYRIFEQWINEEDLGIIKKQEKDLNDFMF